MNIKVGSVVWAKMRGYPTWPSVTCEETSTGLFQKGTGSSSKFHVRFLGGDWAPSWIPKSNIQVFRKQDTEEHRGKRYRVCQRWEIQHLKAMQAGLRMLAKEKPKKIGGKNMIPGRAEAAMEDGQGSNELKKTVIAGRKHLRFDKTSLVQSSLDGRKPADLVGEIGCKRSVNGMDKAKARSEHEIGENIYDQIKKRKCQPLTNQNKTNYGEVAMEDGQSSNELKKTVSTARKRFRFNKTSTVESSLDGRKPTDFLGETGCKRSVNGVDKAKVRSEHEIGENMYDQIKKRKCQPLTNGNKTNYCIGTVNGSVNKTNRIPVTGEQEEQNEIPIRSLSRSESNNDFENLKGPAIDSHMDLHENVLQNVGTRNAVDNDDIVYSTAVKDTIVSNETRNISRNITVANYDDSEENIEEIPRREMVISAGNISIARTWTTRMNDNMIVQHIQEAHFPSYNWRL